MKERGGQVTGEGDPVTRRDFLNLVASSTAVGVGVYVGLRFLAQHGLEPVYFYPLITSDNKQETLSMISDIVRYRTEIGISSPHIEIQISMFNTLGTEWEEAAPHFSNELPEHLESYGVLIEEFNKSILGENGNRLVRGAELGDFDGRMAFNAGNRHIILPSNASEYEMDVDNFVPFYLHEALGHGTDPRITTTKYPFEVLLKVLHGKWRMLAQSFSVNEEAFNYPFDKLYRNMGERFGRLYNANCLDLGFNLLDISKVREIARSAHQKYAPDGASLRFNKAVCHYCGKQLVDSMLAKEITFEYLMKDGYEQSMDQGVVLLEMYAEMMELAVTNPDSTYDNKEVIAGIEEVISAISGENITIEQIREIVNNPSEQVRKRNEEEILLIQEINSGEPSEHEYESISPGEKVKIQTERGEEEQDLDDFTSFVRTGEVPDDMVSDPEIKKVLEQYAQAVSTVHSRHHGALYASNEFDPWLNLWEIQEIEQATDHVFIRGILENPGAIGDSEIADVKVRTDLLRAFINSGAF